jgi:hypothetical protein
MPVYRVQFVADPTQPLPLVEELPNVEAENPAAAVEAMLAAGKYPQDPAIRWARVVLGVHESGRPSCLARFPITPQRTETAMDWDLPNDNRAL